MTPEQQAEKLAVWLESHPGAEPPEGLDPDVIEAVYALRPDLAPPPRVSVDDILGAVTSGPLAPGWTPETDAPEGDGGAVVPFPVSAAPVAGAGRSRRPWARWAFGGAAGTLVAMAAAALLVVRFVGGGSPDSAAPMASATRTPSIEAEHLAASPDEAPPEAEPEVADLGEDVIDDVDETFARDGAAWRGAGGVLEERKDRPTEPLGVLGGVTSSPAAPPVAVTARPKPSPAPTPVAARPVISAPTLDLPTDDVAVAELEEEEEPQGPIAFEPARETVATTTGAAAGGETLTLDSEAGGAARTEPQGATASRRPTAGTRLEREKAEADEVVVVAESARPPRRDTRPGASAPAIAEPTPQEDLAAAHDATRTVDLDALRARAVPVDLPQGELLSRAGTEANVDARLLVSQGRYVEAGNALLPTVTLPAPQGSTNAAQAATWFLQGDDAALARTAAEAGLANTSGNTAERAWLWVLYGDALRRDGDLAGATTAYNEAIGLNAARSGDTPEPASEP